MRRAGSSRPTTVNPNIGLRYLLYIAELYEKTINRNDMYKAKVNEMFEIFEILDGYSVTKTRVEMEKEFESEIKRLKNNKPSADSP